MKKKIIDIHNHSLCGVDDGAKSMLESIEMIRSAVNQGIEAIVLTPHYRHGMFAYPKEEIEKQYDELVKLVSDMGIKLYIGCEYHVNSDIVTAFDNQRCYSLAKKDYVLTEYSHSTEYAYIVQYTRKLVSCGYTPVIAHVERYECIQKQPKLCIELSDMGAWIQVNADSILGMESRTLKHVCKKLLKDDCVDVIASDAHGIINRQNHMGQCYDYIEKKYGIKTADRLFYENPKRIII